VELKERLMALHPHVITMSATPIPRSLASVLYAGHSVSSIRERPPGRQPVQTQVVQNEANEVGWIDRMRQTLRKEQQVFVVCPSIASQEIANVTDTANTLQSHLGAQSVRVLHGDMDSKDIERTLADFRDNRFGVLVATTIIEVGIDVPRATLMVIRDPERLGLSQLHQIRGRVGRGAEPGSCILLTRCSGAPRERLDFFARTQDGFALAEMDMHNRGAGDLGGLEQSGFLDVNLLALGEEATTIQRFLTRSLTSDPEHWLDQIRFEVSI
jgi:ATP-dependent DNA helicase RecG